MKKSIYLFAFLISFSMISQTGIAFEHVNVIDVENSEILNDYTILVEGNLISDLFKTDTKTIDNSQFKRQDMSGKYVIPGLIDGHVHLFANRKKTEALEMLLASGVTSVRDMGGDARIYKKLNEAIDSDSLRGPKIYFSATFFGQGFMEDPRTKFANKGIPPGKAPWMRLITSETNIAAAVKEAKEAGATGIKLYASLTPEMIKAISSEAHKQGLKVWSHASVFPSRPSDAVAAQVDGISHSVGMIGENASTLPNTFKEGIQQFIPSQDFDAVDLNSEKFQTLFVEMKNKGVIFEPTISSWKRASKDVMPHGKPKNGPPNEQMQKARARLNIPSMINWMNRITKEIHQEEILINAGTDFTMELKWIQDEIRFLVEAGLTEIEAIKAASLNNAKLIGIEKTHGSIKPGKNADLVILEANPVEDILNLKKVHMVMKNGSIYGSRQ